MNSLPVFVIDADLVRIHTGSYEHVAIVFHDSRINDTGYYVHGYIRNQQRPSRMASTLARGLSGNEILSTLRHPEDRKRFIIWAL